MLSESEILELLSDNKIDEVYNIIYEEFVKMYDNVEHIRNFVAMLMIKCKVNLMIININDPISEKIVNEITDLERIAKLITCIGLDISKINQIIEKK